MRDFGRGIYEREEITVGILEDIPYHYEIVPRAVFTITMLNIQR